MKYQVFLIIAITFCISAWAKVLPSPAGGGWLELTQPGGYVYIEDHPDFDANLASDFTIQMWICFKQYPKFLEAWPLIHKPDSYLIIIYGFLPTVEEGIKRLPNEFAADLWYWLNGYIGGSALRPPWVPINSWHHVMLIKQGNLSASFLDGRRLAMPQDDVKVGDTDSPVYLTGTTASSIRINLRGAEWKPFTGGLIDEVEIANTARYSPLSREVPISAGRLSPDKHTLALWHFDEPTGDSSYEDLSGNGNTLFLQGFNIEPRGKLSALWGRIKEMQ